MADNQVDFKKNYRLEKVEDVVTVGDIIPVKVIKISEKGIDLSRKDAIAAIKAAKNAE